MFLYDEQKDIYHLFTNHDRTTRCGLPTKGLCIALVADESNVGRECEECNKIPDPEGYNEFMREVMENF